MIFRQLVIYVTAFIIMCAGVTSNTRAWAQDKPGKTDAQMIPPPTDPEVDALIQRGVRLENSQEALTLYKKAAHLASTKRDLSGEAIALSNMGEAYFSLGQFQKSIKHSNKALEIFQNIGGQLNKARTINNIGAAYNSLGEKKRAIEYYKQALPIIRGVPDYTLEGVTLSNIGVAYVSLGEYQKAMSYYNQALVIQNRIKDSRGKAITAINMAEFYFSLGKFQKALSLYHQSLPSLREPGDRKFKAIALQNIGVVYNTLGQSLKALEYYKQVLPIRKSIGDPSGKAFTLQNIGVAYASLGEYPKALGYLDEALSTIKQVGDRRSEATILNNIGSVYDTIGHKKKALNYFKQALTIHRDMENRRSEAIALNNIGIVYFFLGNYPQALEYSNQALLIKKSVGDRIGEAATLQNIGAIYGSLKQKQRSLEYFEKATALLDNIRQLLPADPNSRMAFQRETITTYLSYTSALTASKLNSKALEVAQKTKARTLVEGFDATLESRLTSQEKPSWINARDSASVANIDFLKASATLTKERNKGEKANKKTLEKLQIDQNKKRKALDKAEGVLASLDDKLYIAHPELSPLNPRKTSDLAHIQRWLPEDTALIEFISIGTGSKYIDHTVCFVVAKATNGAIRVETVLLRGKNGKILTTKELARQCSFLFSTCSDRDKAIRKSGNKNWIQPARTLYQTLFQPIEKYLVGKKRLILCPDGPLWDVPFVTLIDNSGTLLMERFELSLAYSSTGATYAATQGLTKPSQNTMLVMANPTVDPKLAIDDGTRPGDASLGSRPSSRRDYAGKSTFMHQEGVSVAERFKGSVAVFDTDATETLFKAQAGKYRFVHVASHGYVNDFAPMVSGLVLAKSDKDDGVLTAREIAELDLRSVELAVFSGCQTGRGETRTGEGVFGLLWSLTAAGCQSALVSQWRVDDAATTELITAFFDNQNQGNAKALQLAMRRVRKTHPHPYYWAPFFLAGKGK